jgi:hypothetical protein
MAPSTDPILIGTNVSAIASRVQAPRPRAWTSPTAPPGSGGADGGGSRLTPEARDLCQRFRRVAGGNQDVVSRRFAAELGEMSDCGD